MDNPYQAPQSVIQGNGSDPEADVVYDDAPVWTRALAFGIDALLFIFFFIAAGTTCYVLSDEEPADYTILLAGTLGGVAGHVAINCAGWASRGQSLGKRVFGLYIVRKNWEPCSLGRLLFRHVPVILAVLLIPAAGLFIGLLDVVLILRQEPSCLHDDLADTAVIRAVKG